MDGKSSDVVFIQSSQPNSHWGRTHRLEKPSEMRLLLRSVVEALSFQGDPIDAMSVALSVALLLAVFESLLAQRLVCHTHLHFVATSMIETISLHNSVS